MDTIVRNLRRAVLHGHEERQSDGQLLTAFLERRDEVAFAALVRRLGPLVMAACRRVLGHAADAEDAFQATFVILFRRAGAIRARERVGAWLYGVATRTAQRARAMRAKQAARERAVAGRAEAPPVVRAEEELLRHLDAELERLPAKYRDALVLCELQGKPRKEAARLLGIPEGTLSSRLATGRQLLARRMAKHGPALAAGALAVALTDGASAAVPAPLILSTVRAASGALSAPVAALVQGALKAMLLTKLKVAAWVAVASLSLVAVTFAQRPATSDPPRGRAAPAARTAPANADALEALRLEIEALRLDLKATRERVRLLEAAARSAPATKPRAVQSPNGPVPVPPGGLPGVPPPAGNVPSGGTRKPHATEREPAYQLRTDTVRVIPRNRPAGGREQAASAEQRRNEELQHAEAALKLLRAKSRNPEAIRAFDEALQWLQSLRRPNTVTPPTPPSPPSPPQRESR